MGLFPNFPGLLLDAGFSLPVYQASSTGWSFRLDSAQPTELHFNRSVGRASASRKECVVGLNPTKVALSYLKRKTLGYLYSLALMTSKSSYTE